MLKLRNRTFDKLSIVNKNGVRISINAKETRRYENAEAVYLLANFQDKIDNLTEIENNPDYRKYENNGEEFDVKSELSHLKQEFDEVKNYIKNPSWFKRLCSLIHL